MQRTSGQKEKTDHCIDLVIFGYGMEGVKLYRKLRTNSKYRFIGFADNSPYKQGGMVGKHRIFSMNDLINLKADINFSVIIAANRWFDIGEELEKNHIHIEGIYRKGDICQYDRMCFERLDLTKEIMLYAGDIPSDIYMSNPDLYGLSINKADARHILHDITNRYPLPDNSIAAYQAEDVLEHIAFEKLTSTIDEIYRILKKDGIFRICMPDYYSAYLSDISMKNEEGEIIFDPTGGGTLDENGVGNLGHVWFPNYDIVRELLEKTRFKNVEFLCYHTQKGKLIRKKIDFSKGYINRLPREGETNRPVYSMVVDCYK